MWSKPVLAGMEPQAVLHRSTRDADIVLKKIGVDTQAHPPEGENFKGRSGKTVLKSFMAKGCSGAFFLLGTTQGRHFSSRLAK